MSSSVNRRRNVILLEAECERLPSSLFPMMTAATCGCSRMKRIATFAMEKPAAAFSWGLRGGRAVVAQQELPCGLEAAGPSPYGAIGSGREGSWQQQRRHPMHLGRRSALRRSLVRGLVPISNRAQQPQQALQALPATEATVNEALVLHLGPAAPMRHVVRGARVRLTEPSADAEVLLVVVVRCRADAG